MKKINGKEEIIDRETPPKEQVSHPAHYQGSCAESWDLSVLEWGPEYAIAAWIVQAQQYYDRHKGKNGVQDLKKAKTFIDHAYEIDNYYDNIGKEVKMHKNFWGKVYFLEQKINEAIADEQDEEKSI